LAEFVVLERALTAVAVRDAGNLGRAPGSPKPNLTPLFFLSLEKHGDENDSRNGGKRQQSYARDDRSRLRSSPCRHLSARDVCFAATVRANIATLKPLTLGLREWRLDERERVVAVGAGPAAPEPEKEQPGKKQ